MKKSLVSLAVVATLAVSGAAQAGVMAVGEVLINTLQINKVAGGVLTAGTDIGIVAITNTGNLAAGLNGVTVNSDQSPTALPFDSPMACVGNCAIAQNTFGTLTAPATTTRARSDSLLTGSIIAGTGIPTPATANLVNEAQVLGTNTGTAQGNIGLSGTVTFLSTVNAAINVSMNAAWRLITDITNDVTTGGAQASIKWQMEIRDLTPGGTSLFFAPGQINRSTSANIPLASQSIIGSSAFTSDNYTLIAGHTYQVGITHETRADAIQVPEPGSVALLGLGLLTGFASLRRRRATTAA